MTPLTSLYASLFEAEKKHRQMKEYLTPSQQVYFSKGQLRVFRRRKDKLSKVIKRLQHEISIHPNHEKTGTL